MKLRDLTWEELQNAWDKALENHEADLSHYGDVCEEIRRRKKEHREQQRQPS